MRVDSWHMSGKVMSLKGGIDKDCGISLLGSYEVPPGPDWGWRNAIKQASANDLLIIMHNISPERKEELAVQADYTRIGP